MRDYELVLLMRTSDGKEIGKSVADELVKKAVGSGKVEKVDEWGIKPLAYPIQKQTQAAYFSFLLALEPAGVLSLDKALAREELILRHLLIRKEGRKLTVDSVQPTSKEKVERVAKAKEVKSKPAKKTNRKRKVEDRK